MANDKTEIMGDPPSQAAVEDIEQVCPNCQAVMLAGEQFCPKCGYQRGTWQAGGSGKLIADERTAVFELRSASGAVWPVFVGENEIGRGEVRIQLDNPYASRLHAKIVVADDATAAIVDLGSSNGTLIAGEAIAPKQPLALEPGVEFKIGEDTFSLHVLDVAVAGEEAETDELPELTDEGQEQPGVEPEAPEEDEAESADESEAGDLVMSPWSLAVADGLPHSLPLGETVIGRKATNGGMVIANDGYVSGTHCKVSAGMDRLTVEDLGSTNGTRVGAEQLTPGEPVELKSGDVVTVGQTAVRVIHADDEAEVEPSDEPAEFADDPEAPSTED
jgi:pSer/pThr/pTyr-binding forkhead associated (FHA) protein